MNVTLNGVVYTVTKAVTGTDDFLILTPVVPDLRTTCLALRVPR